MHGLAVLLVLPFLHAEFLQSRLDGADSGLWDLATSPLDADNSLSDAEEFPSQNAIGLDDSTFPTPSSLMAVDVDSPAIFSESDPNTISMDQCSSPDGILHRKKLRTRGALCTNHESPRFNQNPSLAGLDASETIIDPDNRRQCDYQFVTLCCLGPPISPGLVTNCYNYDPEESACWGPWAYYCCSALMPYNFGFNCGQLFPEYGIPQSQKL